MDRDVTVVEDVRGLVNTSPPPQYNLPSCSLSTTAAYRIHIEFRIVLESLLRIRFE